MKLANDAPIFICHSQGRGPFAPPLFLPNRTRLYGGSMSATVCLRPPINEFSDDQLKIVIGLAKNTLERRAMALSPTLWADHKADELAKRAITVAAVSGQHILLIGPTGAAQDELVLLAQQVGAYAFALTVPDECAGRRRERHRFKKWVGQEGQCHRHRGVSDGVRSQPPHRSRSPQ